MMGMPALHAVEFSIVEPVRGFLLFRDISTSRQNPRDCPETPLKDA